MLCCAGVMGFVSDFSNMSKLSEKVIKSALTLLLGNRMTSKDKLGVKS